jgi:hypothetical protein
MEFMIAVAVLAVFVLLAFWTSKTAAEKGRSAGLFFVLGLLFPLVTLIVVSVMQPVQFVPGNVVELTTDVNLEAGSVLPRRFRSVVHAVSVIDNTRVLEIAGPTGTLHWVAAKAVRLSK